MNMKLPVGMIALSLMEEDGPSSLETCFRSANIIGLVPNLDGYINIVMSTGESFYTEESMEKITEKMIECDKAELAFVADHTYEPQERILGAEFAA